MEVERTWEWSYWLFSLFRPGNLSEERVTKGGGAVSKSARASLVVRACAGGPYASP